MGKAIYYAKTLIRRNVFRILICIRPKEKDGIYTIGSNEADNVFLQFQKEDRICTKTNHEPPQE